MFCISSFFSELDILTLFFLDEWLMFDDENVTAVTSEDILKLSGGGSLLANHTCLVRRSSRKELYKLHK